MPELPEVETTRAGIQPHIEQQRIQSVVIRQPKLRWPIPDDINHLQGQLVKQVTRRGKYLLLHTDIGTALIHLGMSGSLRVLSSAVEPSKHDHWDMMLTNGMCLRYRDPRRFGALLWTTEAAEQHERLVALGVEPLSEAFDGAYLYQQARRRRIPVKNFIMDSRVVVGVGNIYASESLFMARINPTKPADKLSLKRYQRLADAIKQVLQLAIEQGGTTLKDFVREDGQQGYFQVHLRVYGREGLTCFDCSQPIKKIQLGQRSSFYCSKCQRL